MQKVKSLVSDGCEKMVGWEKGVHAGLKKIFKVSFGRIICFFHHLEQSIEVILLLYSGRTISPGSYSSGVGKEVMGDVHKLPVKDFEVLPNEYLLTLIDGTSAEVFKNLSNDHQIMLRLLRMVTTTKLDERYTAMKIGPVVISRFKTTEARTLRKYMSEEKPSFELAHPEFVLLGMLASSTLSERKKAVEIIFRVRSRGPIKWKTPSGVRPFMVRSLLS